MTDRPNNPPAFPMPHGTITHGSEQQIFGAAGMDLRDYIATHALAGILTNNAILGQLRDGKPITQQMHQAAADCAYGVADAMLRARQKGGEA